MAPRSPSGNAPLAVPAAMAAGLVALALWPGAFELLRWDRAAIGAGEWWRTLTGQFVHLGPGHAALNLAGLAALALLLRRDFRHADWAGATLASLAAVAGGLQWLSPGVDWYAGLSGALHGILAAAAVTWIRQGGPGGWLLALVLAGKLGAEALFGPSPASERLTGGPVLVDAHLWGSLGGLAWGLAGWARPGSYNPPPRPGAAGEKP